MYLCKKHYVFYYCSSLVPWLLTVFQCYTQNVEKIRKGRGHYFSCVVVLHENDKNKEVRQQVHTEIYKTTVLLECTDV